jgi:hypothetical protein
MEEEAQTHTPEELSHYLVSGWVFWYSDK